MIMIRRTELEIATEILTLCKTPTGKTGIVYQCNMNFHTVKQYLKKLIKADMLQKIDKNNRIFYETTFEGKEYIFEAIKAVETIRLLNVG